MGERLSFEGVAGGPFEPASAAQMEKKKVLDKVLPVRCRFSHPQASNCSGGLRVFRSLYPCWVFEGGRSGTVTPLSTVTLSCLSAPGWQRPVHKAG